MSNATSSPPAPPIHAIERVELPAADVRELRNGARLYVVDAAPQPVVKLEVIIAAGRWHEQRESISAAMNALWKEGTDKVTGAAAAERIDFYGATLQGYNSLDHVGFTLYALERFLPQVLPLVFDLLLAPAFPRKELDTFIERAVGQLRINADKPDVQAYRLLTEALFGQWHPYGYNSSEAGLRSLTVADLQAHHRTHVTGGNTVAFASGKISAASRELIESQLRRLPFGKTSPTPHTLRPLADRELHLGLPNSLQSAIRLGRLCGDRNDADYAGLYVLNTILGGYFGSRLMTELREERGLTYNIDSSVDTMRHGGYFYIAAEVAAGKEAESIAAIHEEMARLREELVEEEELEMVRSYLMGSYLSMVDGPFNTAETLRALVVDDAPLFHFDRLVNVTRDISAAELQALAREYLDPADWVEVVVGPKG